MPAIENLKEGHNRLVKDMRSSSCLCVHADYFAWKIFLNVDLMDIVLIDKSDVWFFKAKVFHIEDVLSLHCIFLKDLYFCWSEVVIVNKNVSNLF